MKLLILQLVVNALFIGISALSPSERLPHILIPQLVFNLSIIEKIYQEKL